jgi:hypothetical protein
MEQLRLVISVPEATALRTDIAQMQAVMQQMQALEQTLNLLNTTNKRATDAKLVAAGHNPSDYTRYEVVDTATGAQLLFHPAPKDESPKE